MAKKSKRRVKRVLGVKIPKPVGRFLGSRGGQAAVAGAAIVAGVAAARHPRVQAAAMMAGYELQRAGASAGHAVSSAAKAALTPVIAALQPAPEAVKKKSKRSPRLAQDGAERGVYD